jgi:hypothetical protein
VLAEKEGKSALAENFKNASGPNILSLISKMG